MNKNTPLSLFSGYGVEIEYMIVNQRSLNILPVADRLLYDFSSGQQTEIVENDLCFSNELALHIIELKTNGPCKNLSSAPQLFKDQINLLNNRLSQINASLLPTGAHPWMDTSEDFKMWPHNYNEIYKAYDNIFNCKSHGWCNVQSTHLNLPFANDDEFVKLHSAIRFLLPIIPAISASSPIIENEPSGYVDTRLYYYNQNQKKIPVIIGKVIPEYVSCSKQYHNVILNKIYKAISPYDKKGILQYEWLNSRGAIARFDRNTIEIRIMDAQESPLADLSIIALIVSVLQNLINKRWGKSIIATKISTRQLQQIYLGVIKYGSNYKIIDRAFLELFGCFERECMVMELWKNIFNDVCESKYCIDKLFITPIKMILSCGNLSERILSALNGNFSRKNITSVYKCLKSCLQENSIFIK